MSTYRKILVAVDLSEEAEQVLQTAADIAEANQAELYILHVADTPVSPYGQFPEYAAPVSTAEIRASIFAQLATTVENAGLSRELITIDFGRSIDSIIEHSDEYQCDLIVIGSHGRHGIQLLLGSTANGVLHHANCDVLAVRVREVIEQ
ncbi:MAG: universal stress protein [Oceanicoccus sp.]|uniref:universal stress protein n=1 Tax=Oceanicoccus sp. TaxID=2691044 RepID=UPI002610D11F|nr:universal stress protein [Oceanicoccus sp.]MCP3908663.1 universal stress protein [Oceanicoccus sp.]MDG1772789.1 universal stress protein [Oceanicoccus sp.]